MLNSFSSYICGCIVMYVILAIYFGEVGEPNKYKDGYQAGYKAQYTYLLKHDELKNVPFSCTEIINGKCLK